MISYSRGLPVGQNKGIRGGGGDGGKVPLNKRVPLSRKAPLGKKVPLNKRVLLGRRAPPSRKVVF